jgi:hypothetical protein
MAIVREYTDELITLAQEGGVSWETLATELMEWMSELEVKEFAIKTGYFEEDEEDDNE